MADPKNEQAVPALLGRVIKSINEGNKKLDKIANPKKDAADKEAEKEQARQAAHQSKTLDGILAAVSSGDKASKAGGENKKKSGLLSGIFGGVGAGLGAGIAAFGASIAVLGKGFGIAMGFLGAGIAAFFTGIGVAGGGIYLMSKGMPAMVTGLKEFEKLDGPKLVAAAKGIGAMGGAMLVKGMGDVSAGIGSVVTLISDGIGALFGKKKGSQERLIDDLITFQNMTGLDHKKIEKNAKSVAAYGKAMAVLGLGQTASGLGAITSAIGGGLTKLFGLKPPIEQMKDLAKEEFTPKMLTNLETTAKAMGTYALTMGKMAGAQSLKGASQFINLVGNAFDFLSTKLGGKGALDTALSDMQKMSDKGGTLNLKNIENLSSAMGTYALAMAKMAPAKAMKAPATFFNVISNAFDGLSKAFKGNTALDNSIADMQKMSKVEKSSINLENLEHVSTAMGTYAVAMAKMAGAQVGGAVSAGASFFGTVFDGLRGLAGEEKTNLTKSLENIKQLSNEKITKPQLEQLKINTQAMGLYASTMMQQAKAGGGGALSAVGDFFRGVFSSLASLVGVGRQDPLVALKSFASEKNKISETELANIKTNTTAIGAYATAMKNASAVGEIDSGFADTISNIMEGISSWFGDNKDPMKDLKNFSKHKIDDAQIKKNVDAIKHFAGLKNVSIGAGFASSAVALANGLKQWELVINGGEAPPKKYPSGHRGRAERLADKKAGTFGMPQRLKGLKDYQFSVGNVEENIAVIRRLMQLAPAVAGKKTGGYMTAGSPFMAHDGELVIPSNSGLVANSSVTQAILKAGIDRLTGAPSAMQGGGDTIVAPNTVNNTSYVNNGVEIRRALPLVAVG